MSTNRAELSASSSLVEIASVPCQFYATKYRLLEDLFVPMLACAQEASDVMGLRVADEKAAIRACAYLAGELVRDVNFIPTRTFGGRAAHAYLIDLPENHFQVETGVLGSNTDKASIFRLLISGPIRGDQFLVTDPVTKTRLFSFSRFEAEKAEFFVRDFPFLATEARKDPSLFAGADEMLLRGSFDMTVEVPMGRRTVQVRVQKQPEKVWIEVRHCSNGAMIMSLPFSVLGNMPKLIRTVGKQLVTDAAASAACNL